METGALGMETSAATDPRLESMSTACVRRRAWAQSKDSVWQESKPGDCCPQGPQQTQTNGNTQRPSEEPGQVPNKITNWLSECRTPLGASLDDQSASPSKGALRNGCSFEDDLSLGAEANHLQSSNNKTESCFGLAADQKRSQYKERGRSMNSTGSGKSSTVSSVSEMLEQSEGKPVEILLTLRVSELLDLYEEDPEEILLNLGFGREEPDLSSKIPSRFFNSTSSARGIDIKVYLGAQLQRMELENPNYALTSRFRQIEVLTTVANEFFQLYSQVSGQPVQRISSKDLGGDGGEGGGAGSASEQTPPQKKSRSAVNVAKQLLKKSISKHNLLAASPESPEGQMSNQQLNGHATASDHTHTNGHAYAGTDQDGCSATSGHQVETVIQKHTRKKDNCSLATVTEETNGDGESDRLTDNSPDQSSTRPEPDSADLQSTNQRTEEEGGQEVKEENNLTSTPDKAPASLTPPQLAQLRSENADSFDMEEIQSNEDESQSRTSRATDLLRTVSQQSDSSGFAEEPSADSNTNLKVQDSSDSCDSETTVTSHPSQDVATPLAMDQPAFDLPDGREEGAGPVAAVEADRSCISREEDAAGSPEPVPQYTAHHLPRSQPMGAQQEETQDEEEVKFSDRTDPEPEQETTQSISTVEPEPLPQLENVQNVFVSEQEPQPAQAAADTGPPTEGAESVEVQAEAPFSDDSASLRPPAPSSPLQSALNRAKQQQLNRVGSQSNTTSQTSAGRRSFIPLQRSSSLPSSILTPPSRVVPSVRIQFGRGQTSYYTPPKQPTRDTREEEQEEEEEGQTNYLSTVTINPGSSSGSNKNPLPATPPKPFPRHLMRSSYSLQSSSPPPDWSPGGHAQSWSTQSVPDLSSNRRPPTHFPANQHQQSWNPGQMTFPNPLAQCSDCSPSPFTVNPPPQSPSPLHPYASLPNLHHYHHHSSLTSLHQPNTPPVPPHGSMSNFHHPSTSTAPHLVSLGHFPPGSPTMHQQGYNHPYNHQLPYNAAQHGSPFASPYLGYHGYSMNPHMPFPHPVSQYSPLVHEHSLYPGLAPSAPGFLHPRLGVPAANLSSTEMQLRRVLHEIRGTVQSLAQNRADTPGAFSDHSAALPSNQSLTEFQQKRRNLNLFRSQMMDLELSILQQQAVVYKHLSPADRLELEQLQSLRSAVREELQELEQQLEDRLLELTHNSQHRGLHVDRSVDSLSTASALRAMEPMSDLLREQLFLQSEISYGGHAPSTGLSSRASSPDGGGEGEQRGGVYKASINITPTLRPGPSKHTEEEEEEEEEENKEEVERDRGAAAEEGGGRGGESPEEEGAAGVRVDNLQQLISEIRKSVAQEVRREIYSELLAAVSPQRSPVPSQQQPL